MMAVRMARLEDAPAMGRVMVETFLSAHRGQVSEEVMEQRRQEWTPAVSARNWERLLRERAERDRPGECLYVAEDETGEVVGLAMGGPVNADESPHLCASNRGQTIEVYALYVHPEHQGRGHGRRLVRAVASQLAQSGMTALRIGCLAANTPARGFYEALGGRVVGERDGEDGPEVVYGWSSGRALERLIAETDERCGVER